VARSVSSLLPLAETVTPYGGIPNIGYVIELMGWCLP
jgi:hypothetical protein